MSNKTSWKTKCQSDSLFTLEMSYYYSINPSITTSLGTWLVGESLAIMFCNVSAIRNPDTFLLRNVLHKFSQAFRPPWFTSDSRVQRYGHHLPALPVQAVERILQILLVCVSAGADETRKHMKFAVIAFEICQ